MPSTESESPDDNFFNHLARLVDPNDNGQDAQNDASSKVKRIACVLCRKRKLKCDGTRPACGTCKRLSHDCAYDQVRKKSGPKRGYVKLLEQRLQQVEHLLKNQDTPDVSKDTSRPDTTSAYVANTLQQTLPNSGDYLSTQDRIQDGSAADPLQTGASTTNGDADFSWEMISLGLEEPLPPQDVMDELYQIYFAKLHMLLPVVHRPRFFAALNLAPHMRPPVCLRYIMWTMAASATEKYEGLQEHFYQRARKYAQMDEMKGHGESTITLAHCQAWILICTYEFKQMYFPRAWMSAGRAVRLAQMMQLHRIDGVGLDVKQCLPPPKDWTEREERRRTFWMAFCVDRYASIGTGWPMTIDERDITTNLPASEEAFERSKPMATGSLDQGLEPNGATGLQALGFIVLTAAMFGRNLLHLHRPGEDDNDEDINGGFWNRHRIIEQMLLQTSLNLPDHLRLPSGLTDPNVVFANMCMHTSAICLHQAAILKADKHRMLASVSNESKIRCVTAAAEIASIMRIISHMDLSATNPFISFCVYVAARVFVQYLKTRPKDQQMTSSLQFLLQAMQALRRKNPLTESFLAQLDLDLESAGIRGLQQKAYAPPTTKNTVVPANTDPVSCTPIFEICVTQNPSAPINTFGNTTFNTNQLSYSADQVNPQNAHTRDTQYTHPTPGPPFHISNINSVDLNTRNNAYLPPQVPAAASLASAPQAFTPAGFAFPDDTEMDLSGSSGTTQDHTTPTTISPRSHDPSTSHSSYSPTSGIHNLPYRSPSSPKQPSTHPHHITPPNAYPPHLSSNPTPTTLFTNHPPFHPNHSFNNTPYLIPSDPDWDYTLPVAAHTHTNPPPMSDATWTHMLESVSLGWEAEGAPHAL
ncbi:fungal-specific transcription factor domain-containing protein [Ampelomyces quisqualis]|uniref:Fungal-specific transcription factor domain-containing protein n=1 Tax=Ampelomyces quisqualis TaxID=50730 RepID=A0A6A5QL93_AMPQU|nr:fungal-specific transcription factor domain-containing protein [Ampelomyces quisqualis]